MQVHVTQGGKKVRIFSRNSEDMTAKYPDVVARIPRALTEGTSDVVLDCEAVAWDPATKQILPFQVGVVGVTGCRERTGRILQCQGA